MRTKYMINGEPIACGEIESLPGCSQIAVFHSAFVLPNHRNNGHGLDSHLDRLQYARNHMYDSALCTVASTNEYQLRNLEKTGWKKVWQFLSKKTGNLVFVFMKDL